MNELTPYLAVNDGYAALEWYQTALGATISYDPIKMPDGRLGHVELRIGGGRLMMASEFPDIGVEGPATDRGSAVTLHLATDDVDALTAAAVEAGATLHRGTESTDHGRVATIVDPFGHRWMFNSSS